MIVVYPMLISKAVSENIVPGLAKTIEGYIIANAKDAIITDPEVRKNYNFKIKSGKLIRKENVDLSEGSEEEWGGKTKKEKTAENEREEARKQQTKAAEKRAEAREKREQARDKREESEAEFARAKNERDKEKWDIQKRKYEADEAMWEDELERAVNQEKRAQAAEERAEKKLQMAQDETQRAKAKWEADEKKREAEATRDQEKHKADMQDKEAKRQKDEEERIRQKETEDAKRSSASIKISDNKALSIEPSTIDIETTDKYGNRRTESFGVKVIPFRVKSDAKLSRLILHDIQMKSFNAAMVGVGRKITRIVWRFIDRWTGNLKLGGITPSGDPRRDIIMARTGHGGEGFIVLSKTEDIDEIFLNNIKKINRLFKMGWGNIIITDDVNRIAYFCMKKFRGVCTATSYAMIYANFGQLQVYNDLEDAKRKTSSIFKIRKQFSKVVAEWIVDQKQSKYLREDK